MKLSSPRSAKWPEDTTVATRAPDARRRSTIALANGELSVKNQPRLAKLVPQEAARRAPNARTKVPRTTGPDRVAASASWRARPVRPCRSSSAASRRDRLATKRGVANPARKNGWDRSRCRQPRVGLPPPSGRRRQTSLRWDGVARWSPPRLSWAAACRGWRAYGQVPLPAAHDFRVASKVRAPWSNRTVLRR